MKTALVLCLLLSGCATGIPGVVLEDGDAQRCKTSGCTVWTPQELETVVREALKRGYEAGKKAERATL